MQVTSPNGTYPYTSEIIALTLLQREKKKIQLTCQHLSKSDQSGELKKKNKELNFLIGIL